MDNDWRAKTAQKRATYEIGRWGALTTINGGTAVRAVWTEAGTARVQLFLEEDEWKTPAFDVHFPASALSSLVNGAEVKRTKDGWRGVIRLPENHQIEDVNGACTVLVVLATE